MMAAWSLVSWTGWGTSLVAACFVLTMLALFALLRRLPADLTLRAMPESAARQAIAPPPPDIARLRVALLPEALTWSRLDVFLDGVRVGQLRPGTAFVRSMPPGAHALTMRVWLRRLGTAEMINACRAPTPISWCAAVAAKHGNTASSGGTWRRCWRIGVSCCSRRQAPTMPWTADRPGLGCETDISAANRFLPAAGLEPGAKSEERRHGEPHSDPQHAE